MAKRQRPKRVTFSPNPKVLRFLADLEATGLYGSSIAEVVDRLVCETINRKIETGVIQLDRTA